VFCYQHNSDIRVVPKACFQAAYEELAMTKVTVAICTHNRSGLLNQTLTKLQQLHIPCGVSWELLVINNCCTDDTDEVIRNHRNRLPVRCLHEGQPGLSAARNRALSEATGDLILWTDDDVLVDAEWLAEYYRAAQQWPDAAFFGGTVEPMFAVDPPVWIQRNLDILQAPFAVCMLGNTVRPLMSSEMPVGASMGFRRNALRAYRFDPKLGRIGNTLLSGEEVQLFRQMRTDGASGVWVGTARVRHHVVAHRLTRKYLWDWFYGYGMTQIRVHGVLPCTCWFNVPRWCLRNYWQARLRYWFQTLWGDPSWLRAYTTMAMMAGIIAEAREQGAGKALDAGTPPLASPVSGQVMVPQA
jgi:glucosyl-dolichyl phosphate glucuronosyltransferase